MEIARLGETGLISLIQRLVASRGHLQLGIGDDALILKDGCTVMTTDLYAEGVHFDLSYMSYYAVGLRCGCAAISDVVAMGGEPAVLLVGLAVPRQTDSRFLRQLYLGLERICRQSGCEIGGGDIIALDRLVIALTAMGRAAAPVLRSGARPGDFLYITGFAGLAETGRLILSGRVNLPSGYPGSRMAVRRHLYPLPRIAVMRALRQSMTALIDTSDGLGSDARQLSIRSGVAIVIEAEKIPVHAVTTRACAQLQQDRLEFVMRSGEDYELLFTSREILPPELSGVKITRIGRVERGEGLFIAKQGKVIQTMTTGYDHLRNRLLF